MFYHSKIKLKFSILVIYISVRCIMFSNPQDPSFGAKLSSWKASKASLSQKSLTTILPVPPATWIMAAVSRWTAYTFFSVS